MFEPDIHRKCVMHKQRIKGLEKSAEGMNQQIYKVRIIAVELIIATGMPVARQALVSTAA